MRYFPVVFHRMKVINKALHKVIAIFALLALFSCFGSVGRNLDDRDSDLYNRIGYQPGRTPLDQEVDNLNAKYKGQGVTVVPDYYYRGPDPSLTPRPTARTSPTRSISVRYKPSSRSYSNPYSFKPPENFPYFDSDQYYVPPQGVNHGGNGFNQGQSSRGDQYPNQNQNQNPNNNNQLY